MPSRRSTKTLLKAVNAGDQSARDELIAAVYAELRRVADRYLRQERPNHTLQPTALVHEAYLRLVGQDAVRWRNREHFIAVAAKMMRRVLVDHARGHNRDKRGSGVVKLPLASADYIARTHDVDLVTLDEALKRFITDYPEESEIVELRFFGGLSITETAKVLKVSDSTVERGWRFARAWLVREMDRGCR